MSLMIIHTFIKRQDCFTHIICHILNCKICKRCMVYSSPVTLLWNFSVVSMFFFKSGRTYPTHFALFNPCFVCKHFSSHQNVYWAFMFSVGDNQSFCEYFTELQVGFFLYHRSMFTYGVYYTIRWYVSTMTRGLIVHFLLIVFCSRSDSLETKMTLGKPLLKFYC